MLTVSIGFMGKCKFCQESAGFLRTAHKECKAANGAAEKKVVQVTTESITTFANVSNTLIELHQIKKDGYLTHEQFSARIAQGLSEAVESFLADHHLSLEEETTIDTFAEALPIQDEHFNALDLSERIVKAAILRDLSEGKVPDPKVTVNGNLPFLFQKSEKLLWIFQNIEYLERRTRTEYRGGSQGVSIRVTKGVYYRTGAFKGRKVEVEELKSMGVGIVALTTKHLYFGNASTSFKVPYRKIVSLNTYSDGLGIQKDGVRSKPQIFKGVDAWFASNIISNLNG